MSLRRAGRNLRPLASAFNQLSNRFSTQRTSHIQSTKPTSVQATSKVDQVQKTKKTQETTPTQETKTAKNLTKQALDLFGKSTQKASDSLKRFQQFQSQQAQSNPFKGQNSGRLSSVSGQAKTVLSGQPRGFHTSTAESKTVEVKTPVSAKDSSSKLTVAEAVKSGRYVSPYDLECPLDYIVIHNRSKNASNYAIRQLKEVWPNLKIIQVVQGDRDPLPGADYCVRVKDWSSMSHFKSQFDSLAAEVPELRASMKGNKVGFYSVWSAQAESATWATSAQEAGFKWIGASPDKMKGLDKIEYKKLCQEKKIPTADFIEIKPPSEFSSKDEALKAMAKSMVELYKASPELAGKAVFAKHNEGGGGRGTKKIAEMTYENALEAVTKIVNETGGNLNGVYLELALDLKGAQLFQIEIETDKTSMAPGGRLVWFNKENQKVLEVGFNDEAICELIPKEIYAACKAASKVIFDASGYDSRGTNEALIIKDKDGKWSFKMLELNKRIQVENEALSELITDSKGRPKNPPAEQVARAFNVSSPSDTDWKWKGDNIVVHLRLLSSVIAASGSTYPLDTAIDGAIYPQGARVQFAKGPVFMDADPQIGRALLTAQNWKEMYDKLLNFSKEFQFYGSNTEKSNYFDFIRKLASNTAFRNKLLGCNQTFDVLADAPVEKGTVQKAFEALNFTATPLVIRGYRPNEGVKDQPYPTLNQIKEFEKFMDELTFEKAPETPFSKFLEHQDFKRYIKDLKDTLANHGGGTVTVFPRDVMQELGDQESALIQKASAKIASIYFAATGIGVGYETGGAQFQAALMRKFSWMPVLLSGCLSNLPSHSLTRSAWLNGLNLKTPEQQDFYFKTIASNVAKHYGVLTGLSDFLPWFPYNFHAGNHPEQDVTTKLMLDSNLGAMPTWSWDPRFTKEQFTSWVDRQIKLFADAGKPLPWIRIKNAGQSPEWDSEGIVNMIQVVRQRFAAHGLEEPIIYVHNHDYDGTAAHTAAETFKACQKLNFPYLVIDSAPHATTHNSNNILSSALVMTKEEKEALSRYNQGAIVTKYLASRFLNDRATKHVKDHGSYAAGGATASNLASASELKLPYADIEKAFEIARSLFNFGVPVTPYMEYLKQIGISIFLNKDIQPKTIEATRAFIEKGGKLNLAESIIESLRDWKTLLVRPAIVVKLLENLGVDPTPKQEKITPKPLDIEALKKELQAKLPNTRVTENEVATVIGFDKIGETCLVHQDSSKPDSGARDLTPLLDSPQFVHSQTKKVGDTFKLGDQKVTVTKIQSTVGTAVSVDYSYLGHTIPTIGIDPSKVTSTTVEVDRLVQDSKLEMGSPMPGKLEKLLVKVGDKVKKGEPIAVISAMKMEHLVRANQDGTIGYINDKKVNRNVQQEEVVAALKA